MADIFSRISEKLNKKPQVYSCRYIEEALYFDYKNRVRLCPYSDFGIINEKFDGIWLDVEKIEEAKKSCSERIKRDCPEQCRDCYNLSDKAISKNTHELKYLYLSHWKHCYLNCVYCDYPKEEDLIKAGHYDVFPVIKQLLDSKLLTKKTKVIFECGDPCIHPEFDKILYYFINYEMEDVVINTPAQRYCESISEAIAKNIAKVIISFDSGCPYIYERVKGINKFDIAMANIKRYLEFQEPKAKKVMLKYTILNGINDNQKEILDWFIMSRDIGISKLVVDIDRNWYNQIKYSVPQYLKDLLVFVKNISDYNNTEIEFCETARAVYEKIEKEVK